MPFNKNKLHLSDTRPVCRFQKELQHAECGKIFSCRISCRWYYWNIVRETKGVMSIPTPSH